MYYRSRALGFANAPLCTTPDNRIACVPQSPANFLDTAITVIPQATTELGGAVELDRNLPGTSLSPEEIEEVLLGAIRVSDEHLNQIGQATSTRGA